MKLKTKAKAETSAPRRGSGTTPSIARTWRTSELPLHVQVELRERIEQAKRGEGLADFDEAIADADRMSDEMLSILSRDALLPRE